MKIPTVNTCCCGCSLKQGTQIIGWVELISYILVLGSSVRIANTYAIYKEELGTVISPETVELLYASYIIIAVICSIQIITTFLLLWGVKQENPSFMTPWKIFAGVYILMSLITLIIICVAISSLPTSGELTASIIYSLAGIIFKIYLFIVVHSYSLELINGASNTGGSIPPGFARNA